MNAVPIDEPVVSLPNRRFRANSRASTEAKVKRYTLETYCTIGNVDLKRIARKHQITVGQLQQWIENGNWHHLRRRRQEIIKTMSQITNPRDMFVALIQFIEQVFSDVRRNDLTHQEGAELVKFARMTAEALEKNYDQLGIKYKQGDNAVAYSYDFDSAP